MNDSHAPVIVGIDGSDTAVQAAQWAVDEATSRSVPLRLVYVAKATHPSSEDYYDDVHRGEAALRTAQAAVESTAKPVKVETAIVDGPPGAALVAQSRDAQMICVGSVGIGRYARSILGSTASELAENAHCPVAVIRPSDEESRHAVHWVIVAANREPGNEAVIECAMGEAKLRHAPVLVLGKADEQRLDHEVDAWKRRYPDVHIYPVADTADVGRFLKNNDERVEIAVIGGADADELARIVGSYGHPRFHRTVSSALVVRH